VDNSIRMSGFAEVHGFDSTLNLRRKQCFINYLKLIMDTNNLNLEEANFYTCHRPVSPDDVPLIGALSSKSNLYVNLGHGSGGWTMAFGSSFLLGQIMAKKTTPIDPTPYDPNRFL